MIRNIDIKVKEPQWIVSTGVAFAQVDTWFGHSRLDLKMDIIYPDVSTKKYPCIVWICGGGFMSMNRSAHLAYLCQLARAGFVVASVDYRTCNLEQYPTQLEDVKRAIRYLRAHADRYSIDTEKFGTMGESAGGYLAAMAALAKGFDRGDYLDFDSSVQAACLWYPVTDFNLFDYKDAKEGAVSFESSFMGFNVFEEPERARKALPVSHVTKDAPPVFIIHGDKDNTVSFAQGKKLHDLLEKQGCDANLLTINGADHSDIRFFQAEIWDEIIEFFRSKLSNDN